MPSALVRAAAAAKRAPRVLQNAVAASDVRHAAAFAPSRPARAQDPVAAAYSEKELNERILADDGSTAGRAPSGAVGDGASGGAAGSSSHGAAQEGPERPSHRWAPLFNRTPEREMLERMIRIDHAGEYGAVRIYEGQLAVLGKSSAGDLIREMQEHEKRHLEAFNETIREYRVRPTALLPVWHVAGYALGMGTALLGKEAAMACTVAVEEVISEHYNDQVRTLTTNSAFREDEALKTMFREFRDDEEMHREIGVREDAERAPLYGPLTQVIKAGCRAAIWISSRV
eukprot:tig00000640_g2781.t1